MKKIKGLLFAFVALFAFAIAMVTVKAEGEPDVFDASTLANSENKSSISAGNTVYDGSLFKLQTTGKAAYISGFGGGDGKNEQPIEGTLTAKTADSSKTFSKALICNSTTTAGTNGYTITAKANIKFTVYFTISDSNITKGSSMTVSSNKTGDIVIGSKTVEISPANKLLGTAYKTDGSDTLGEGESVLLASSANRLILFSIVAEETADVVPSYAVTIYNGSTVLKEESIKATDDYTPSVKLWGFDVTGYYTDAECTEAFVNGSKLTADTPLYVATTAWSSPENPNVLTSEMVGKLNGVYNLGKEEIQLTSVYSVLTGCAYNTSNSEPVIATGGAGSTSSNAVKIQVTSAGTLTANMIMGSDKRSIKLLDSEGQVVSVTSGNPEWATDGGSWQERTLTYSLEEGTYYLCGSNAVRIFSLEFVPAPTMPFYQDTAYNAEGVELVRYVAVVEGVSEEDIAGNYSLVITSAALDEALDATDFCVIANELLNGEEAYTIGDATFEVKDGTLYVVCVLGVSGGDLGDKYKDEVLTATLTVNGDVIGTFNYTVLGAQA